MTSVLRFTPIYQERVWGGRGLESFLGRKLPGTTPIGESWEIVDRVEAQSRLIGGAWDGWTFREALRKNSGAIMGPQWPADRPFPILVKWLDCRERLSLQVHPPASIAPSLGGEPKTENWYIAHAEPGAAVLAGLTDGVTSTKFREALERGTVESVVHRLPTRAGDSLLIRSGVMHAIDAGNIILEIQQNSDTTYRVYDWGRVGLDGKPRALHLEQSIASLEANAATRPALVHPDARDAVLASCAEFRITRRTVDKGGTVSFVGGQEVRILSVVDGVLVDGDNRLKAGDNVVLPFAAGFSFRAESTATMLLTDRFSSLEN